MSSTRMLPISNPAHHLLSQCQSNVYYSSVRKKPFTEWKQGHTPESGFRNPCLRRGFLFGLLNIDPVQPSCIELRSCFPAQMMWPENFEKN